MCCCTLNKRVLLYCGITVVDHTGASVLRADVSLFSAGRYAGLLEATMDHVPSVCPIEPAELLDFCTDSGYSYRVEAQGSLLIPPDYYVGMTDWERSLRLRYSVHLIVEQNPQQRRSLVGL